MARGKAVSGATGLAGITNGDVIRQGSINLSESPYVARAYLRWLLPLGPERQQPAEVGARHVGALAEVDRALADDVAVGDAGEPGRARDRLAARHLEVEIEQIGRASCRERV